MTGLSTPQAIWGADMRKKIAAILLSVSIVGFGSFSLANPAAASHKCREEPGCIYCCSSHAGGFDICGYCCGCIECTGAECDPI
jgi:hypothetical protein